MDKPEIKLKPWGREIWFAHTEKYAGKILEVTKGNRYSLQYHEKKIETLWNRREQSARRNFKSW